MKSYLMIAAALVLCITTAGSQPGSLDMAFGTNGHVLADLSAPNADDERTTGVFIQPDGKRVVVVDRYPYIHLIRFNADGSYDDTFGEGGFSQGANINKFGGPLCNSAMQADGKIVAVGETPYNSTTLGDFGVARWNTDGTLDATFGNQGIVQTDIGYWEEALSVKIRPDGKILVAGETRINNHTYLAFAQYNSNGSPDTDFGFGGIHVNPIFEGMGLDDMALNPDGTIMVLCDDFGGSSDFVLARFQSTGPIDPTFTTDGYQEYEWATPVGPFIRCMEIQPDAKILLGGHLYNGINTDLLVARYDADGSIDNTFHGDGYNTTHIGGSETVYDLVRQPDGMIVAAGDVYYGTSIPSKFALARYESDGDLDGTFAVQGTQITTFGGYEGAGATAVALHADGDITAAGGTYLHFTGDVAIGTYDLQGPGDEDGYPVQQILGFYADNGVTFLQGSAVQTDGKLIAAGYAWNGSDYDFVVARFNTDGTPDLDFGIGGYQLTDFSDADFSDDYGSAVAIQADGKIVVTGQAHTFTSLVPVARYNPDGSLDDSFDFDGRVLINYPGVFEEGNAILIQPDGRILIGGSDNTADFDFALSRLNTDGSLDGNFGGGTGMVFTSFGYQDIIFGLALQPDGKILATGNTSLPNSFDGFDFCTARYNSDGTLDLGFGTNGDGRTTTDFDGGFDFAEAVALQPDGKIVVGGEAPVNNDYDFALARYNPDGSPDMQFGNSGKQNTGFKGSDGAFAMSIQNDGKIILAGSTRTEGGDQDPSDFALARYTACGILDGGFGAGGKVISDFDDMETALSVALSTDRIYATGYKYIFRNYTLTDKWLGIVAAYSGNPAPILANGGFESGIPPWSFYTNGTGNIAISSPGASGSGNAAKVTLTTVGDNMQLFQGGIPLNPATSYRLTFRAYSSNGRDISAFMQRHDAPFTNYGLNGVVFNLTTTWQTFTVDFTSVNFPPPTPSNARLRFKLLAVNNTVYYIDDVYLVESNCSAPVAAKIRVETAADGSGTVVPSQTVQPGNSITVYAISRTSSDQFIENISATAWELIDISGTVNPGDLIASGDGKSATFTGLGDGTAKIRATSPGLTPTPSGTITVPPPPSPNLIVNGGFESGTSNWTFQTNGAGSFTFVIPGQVDARSGQISITTPGTTVQLFQQNISLTSGSNYRLSFKAKSTTGHDIQASVFKHVSPFTPYGLTNHFFNLTNTWADYSIDFAASGFGGSVSDARLRFWLAPYDAAGDVYQFDDMKIELLPAPPESEIRNPKSEIPSEVTLAQNFPNPFNPSTTIIYTLPQEARVTLDVFDVLGQRVAQLVNGTVGAGYHDAVFDAKAMSSGLYFYRLTAVGTDGVLFTRSAKMLLAK